MTVKKNVKIILILLVSAFILFQFFTFIFTQHSTVTAQYGTIINTLTFKGYLIKNENVITPSEKGTLQPAVSDGQKIARYSRVGALLSGDVDKATITYYMDLSDRISSVEKISSVDSADTMRLEEQITELATNISSATANGKTHKIPEYKKELIRLLDRKAVLNGKRDTLLAELNSKKSEMTNKMGSGVNELYAPSAGIFSAKIDGFENILTPDVIDTIKVQDIESMDETREESGGGVYKIINNYRWYIAAVIEDNIPSEIKVGDIVMMKINDVESDAVKALVHRISEPENGKCVLILSCSRDCGGVLTKRRVSGEITINSFSGIKVPSSAIVEKDGETGVYSKYLGEKSFQRAEILTKNEHYAIIREKSEEKGYVKLYDEVVLN